MATLLDLAERDDRIELIVGDLGFGLIEPFVERFPSRFTNVGVAEQNMTGIAVGLALTGSVVFTYSIGNFPTLRCLEQIRNDACYHGANVNVVAVGGGLAYGALGVSHHATEDLAVLRSIPGLAVAAPGDPLEVAAVTLAATEIDGPAYIRLGRSGETTVHPGPLALPVGESVRVREGRDVAIVSTGSMLVTAVAASERLAAAGIGASVLSVPWLQPFDCDAVRRAAVDARLVVTLEEHTIRGGLGSAVAEVLAEQGTGPRLFRLGLPPEFTSVVGSQQYLLRYHGLHPDRVAERISSRLKECGPVSRQ